MTWLCGWVIHNVVGDESTRKQKFYLTKLATNMHVVIVLTPNCTATVPSGYKPTDGVRSKNDRMIMVTIAYLFFVSLCINRGHLVQCAINHTRGGL